MSEASLILVRHAAPLIEPDRPSVEWRLSDEGRAAAARLADDLVAYAPAALVSSPEPKAQETAAIIGGRLALEIETELDLVEHRRAGVGFRARDDFEASMAAFFARPAERVFGQESADEAEGRIVAALVRASRREPLIAVSHGTVISLFLGALWRLDSAPLWRSLAMPEAFVLDAGGEPLARLPAR